MDQDKLGIQGHRVGPPQIWEKPLSGGAKAVALFNYVTDDEAEPLTLYFKEVGFTGPVHVRDLWAHKDLGVLNGSYPALFSAPQRRRSLVGESPIQKVVGKSGS